ncbi:hypothetical protein [Weissella cibaria]|uniref:hypothetical protein n=1 Tax=Weissella cibaria TaxID=137591 RepID=UPI0022E32B1A|nr:hypothetical protein [Weissella cibaria]
MKTRTASKTVIFRKKAGNWKYEAKLTVEATQAQYSDHTEMTYYTTARKVKDDFSKWGAEDMGLASTSIYLDRADLGKGHTKVTINPAATGELDIDDARMFAMKVAKAAEMAAALQDTIIRLETEMSQQASDMDWEEVK